MIDWNEDNFLEKLTPQLRKKSAGAIGPCPDAETLCAVIEGVAREPERDSVIEHLAQCAACAELRTRLLNFESVSPPEPEAVWNQTRTRLDNWLEGVPPFRGRTLPLSKRRQVDMESFWLGEYFELHHFREGFRAVGVAVVLVLIVDGVLLLEYRRAQLPQVHVAVRATVPPKPPANPGLPSSSPRDRNLPTKTAQATAPSPPYPDF